jgi:LuxR family quorum-sensing system transcriptional regulator CciR
MGFSISAEVAIGLNASIQQQTDLASCARLFMDVVRILGFDTFACGEVDVDNRDRTAFYIVEWPEAWRKFYIQSGMINRDPLIDALGTRSMPFTWSELRRDRKLAHAGQAALTMAAEQGWTEGLVVSVPRGGSRYGLTSLVGRCGALSEDQRDILSVCCICLLSHVRTIAARSGFPLAPASLSPRELASVQLVAKGLVDQEIADAFGVSRATAHQHVEGAKRKMAVKTRAELVALAVSLGFIEG